MSTWNIPEAVSSEDIAKFESELKDLKEKAIAANSTLKDIRSSISEIESEQKADHLKALQEGCIKLSITDLDKKPMDERIVVTQDALEAGFKSFDSEKLRERREELFEYYLAENGWLEKAQQIHCDILQIESDLKEMRKMKVDHYSSALSNIQEKIQTFYDDLSADPEKKKTLETFKSTRYTLETKLQKWKKIASIG